MNHRKAFSLIEIILVVVIIGMLAVLVMPRLLKTGERARISTAKADLSSIKTAIHSFENTAAYYPSTAEGIRALIVKPSTWPEHAQWSRFLDKRSIPKDPWGQEYIYRYPGTIDPDGYDLISSGPDKKENTEDDIDITK